MNFVVDGVRLMELLWNVLLFANKSGATKGDVHFSIDPETKRLYAVACDDFVVVQDNIELTSSDLSYFSFTLDNASVKALEKKSRDWKETVDISLLTSVGEIQVGNFESIKFDLPDTELWKLLVDVVQTETPSLTAPSDWYLNPDRLKNIPRMKIEGHRDPDKRDQPVAFRYIQGDQIMLAFLYGPSVRGVITSMDEEVLKKRGVTMFDNYVERFTEKHKASNELERRIEQAPENEGPPWDIDEDNQDKVDPDGFIHDLQGVRAKDYLPENLTAQVQYDAPVSDEAPVHVNEEEFNEYGY